VETRARELIAQGDHLFGKREPLMSLWQEICDLCYPERADFTTTRSLGDDFAGHLTTGFPVLARRTLGDAFSAMLRPTSKDWYRIRMAREDMEDHAAKVWMERAENRMRRAMFDRATQFTRATKDADHDFAAIGQAVLSVEIDWSKPALLYRNWHVRDVAWCEGYDGEVDTIHRKWKPTAREMVRIFGAKNVHPKVNEVLEKTPYHEFQCRHVVVPTDQYAVAGRRVNAPFASIFIDVDNEHVMREEARFDRYYVIPRWKTHSGSQYAFSPAAMVALPDMRLLQDMARVLLEAGEKATNPPMLAQKEVIRSDVAIYAGGITWVDKEYDERNGAPIQLLTNDKSGIPLGLEMQQDTRKQIAEAFFINKLGLPPADGRDMTAFEVGQRVQEYIRNALPLFEPIEMNYNGALCEATFNLLMQGGLFGPAEEIPQSLQGNEVQFRFESPLRDAVERQKAQTFQDALGITRMAMEFDPTQAAGLNITKARKDTLDGVGVPAEWQTSEEDFAAAQQQAAERREMEQAAAMAQMGGAAAEQVGKGGQALRGLTEAA
jgi:hypothetical protein